VSMHSPTLQLLSPRKGHRSERRKILIVNVYNDDLRRVRGAPNKVPAAMGPVYLAGAFDEDRCDVRLYNEQHSGPLRDERLLRESDMLVLTGLTSGFDRMRHLTAHARTLNEEIVIAAGGPAVRALPKRAARFFDYACEGDVEQLADVIRDAFGAAHVRRDVRPRYDLAYWMSRRIGYAESSRNCNFHCAFCSMTAERNRYQKYDLEFLRRQLLDLGPREVIVFLDNNFYGSDRGFFHARIDLIRELWQAGHFQAWSALVTTDFFTRPENIELVRRAGCEAVFSGIESFDDASLRRFAKHQNTVLPQVDLIRGCLAGGVVFFYGLILDVTTRTLAELHQELEFVARTPDITLPGFLTLPIPLLGTPFFYDCLRKGMMLPNTRLRDMDGTTLTVWPKDPLDEVARFVRGMQRLRSLRGAALRHAGLFYQRYRRCLNRRQMLGALANTVLLTAPAALTSPLDILRRSVPRTHVSTTEYLDPLYRPLLPVAERYREHFRPTLVTDRTGQLAEDVAEDLRGRAMDSH
jgi:hypothetical protein